LEEHFQFTGVDDVVGIDMLYVVILGLIEHTLSMPHISSSALFNPNRSKSSDSDIELWSEMSSSANNSTSKQDNRGDFPTLESPDPKRMYFEGATSPVLFAVMMAR
jgi:hypothetical protein